MYHTNLRRAYRASLLCLVFLLAGCSLIVTDPQVPGTYKAETGWGTSTLTIRKDTTFQQTVRLKNGQTKQLSGRWKLEKSSGTPTYTTISLSPYFTVTHDKRGVLSNVSVLSIYHVPFGIDIAADPEYGIAHRK